MNAQLVIPWKNDDADILGKWSRLNKMNVCAPLRSVCVALAALMLLCVHSVSSAAQIDLPGPPGSVAFGARVSVLPNGNIVVTDPEWNGAGTNAGAVHLYSPSGTLISTLRGSRQDDRVGSGDLVVLRNGNFLVRSPGWANGSTLRAGAVTWIDGSTGLTGEISAANSLVGTSRGDTVGSTFVLELTNGNYVVCSPFWNNGSAQKAGAATWGNGATGISGPVSATNSLVGTSELDAVSLGYVWPLENGNFVVASGEWNAGRGAATWGNGETGVVGAVSASNSLVGTRIGDHVGSWITPLTSSHFVVVSPYWDHGPLIDVGAVTWASGDSGISGEVSPTNSWIGSTIDDLVGGGRSDQDGTLFPRVSRLEGGDFVIASPEWDGKAGINIGAVTRVDGHAPTSGIISESNSLVGGRPGDRVGSGFAIPLRNGHYVVVSPWWNDAAVEYVGAVTWMSAQGTATGVVSRLNSLVGSTAFDRVGSDGVTPLGNGHYVVSSPYWDRAATADAGAVTWADGDVVRTGVVSADNSLVGSAAFDAVGDGGVTSGVVALANGNYVVTAYAWDRGALLNAGAVTWADGTVGRAGAVSAANSLVGSTQDDNIGFTGVKALANGNFVVSSATWSNGSARNAGAVTWGSGAAGLIGEVTPSNSLVGTSTGDFVGSIAVVLSDGNYIVDNGLWTGCGPHEAGAITLARGDRKTTGTISRYNSVVGSEENESMTAAREVSLGRLVVGRPDLNMISLFQLPTDLVFGSSFDCP